MLRGYNDSVLLFLLVFLLPDDLDQLRGAWLTVSQVYDGKTLVDEKTPPKEGPAVKVAYDGNKWTVMVGEKSVATGMIKVDATKTPKEIDVLDETGTVNEKTRLGIYEVQGDIYKYCMGLPGKPRPREWVSKAGTGHSCMVSKRER